MWDIYQLTYPRHSVPRYTKRSRLCSRTEKGTSSQPLSGHIQVKLLVVSSSNGRAKPQQVSYILFLFQSPTLTVVSQSLKPVLATARDPVEATISPYGKQKACQRFSSPDASCFPNQDIQLDKLANKLLESSGKIFFELYVINATSLFPSIIQR